MGKPVLMSVDDDPNVSRAVARDLRRQYGEEFRVLRAASAAEGLDALRELKLRGDPVAVLLADYRMPEMNGIEFLRTLRAEGFDIKFGFVTSESTAAMREQAIEAGASFLLAKPFSAVDFEDLLTGIV